MHTPDLFRFPTASTPIARALSLVALVAVFAALLVRMGTTPPPAVLAPRDGRPPAAGGHVPQYEFRRVSSGRTPFAHSAAAIETAPGALRAFWFAGSREGATDAAVYSAVYVPHSASWGEEAIALTPARLQRDLARWVRKVGNPVVARGADGRLRLFVVSVTAGGWAGSAINVLVSDDEGASWGPAQRLVASPFFNLSTLVKGAPLRVADGNLVVPAYHELAGKFGELLRLDPAGRVVGKTRLSAGRHSLQPVVVPLSGADAVAFMRYAGAPPARVLALHSADGGRSWGAPQKTALPNPNSAVDALRLPDGSLLLAFNNSDAGRHDLSLAHSRDAGRTWRVIQRVEYAGAMDAEFSYPRLLAAANGDVHLLYTVNKAEIRHLRFNGAWLRSRIE